jgi:hypothetical protein
MKLNRTEQSTRWRESESKEYMWSALAAPRQLRDYPDGVQYVGRTECNHPAAFFRGQRASA